MSAPTRPERDPNERPLPPDDPTASPTTPISDPPGADDDDHETEAPS
jgi:hypothetical protein